MLDRTRLHFVPSGLATLSILKDWQLGSCDKVIRVGVRDNDELDRDVIGAEGFEECICGPNLGPTATSKTLDKYRNENFPVEFAEAVNLAELGAIGLNVFAGPSWNLNCHGHRVWSGGHCIARSTRSGINGDSVARCICLLGIIVA